MKTHAVQCIEEGRLQDWWLFKAMGGIMATEKHGDSIENLLGIVPGHICHLRQLENGGHRALCECTATWTYGAERTFEQMHDIYLSHLKYFNRPKIETL